MQKKLLIFLGHDDHLFWLLIGGDRPMGSGDLQALTQLEDDNIHAETIVFVPTEDILLTNVELPKLSRSRLMQALPYALEEKLTAELSTLHFVAGLQRDGKAPVIVAAKDKMSEWMQKLSALKLKPQGMYPDVFAYPIATDIAHVANNRAIFRVSEEEGFSIETENLEVMLPVLHQRYPLSVSMQWKVYDETKMADIEPSRLSDKDQQQYFIQSIAMLPPMNMLSGAFAAKKKSHGSKQRYLIVATSVLSTLSIALVFGMPMVSASLLKQKVHSLDDEIAKIYYRHFPQAKAIVAPKVRLQEKLQQRSMQERTGAFFDLLANFGEEWKKNTGLHINRLDYQNHQLTVELSAPGRQNFSEWSDAIKQRGYQLKQQNVTVNGKELTATLVIES